MGVIEAVRGLTSSFRQKEDIAGTQVPIAEEAAQVARAFIYGNVTPDISSEAVLAMPHEEVKSVDVDSHPRLAGVVFNPDEPAVMTLTYED